MRFGVLGTGMVGRAIAGRLIGLDHDAMIGTRDVQRTQATSGPDRMGNPPFSTWQRENPDVKLGTFAQAAAHGEVIVNATNGAASIEALTARGQEMYLPIWLRLWGAVKTPMFNIKVVR